MKKNNVTRLLDQRKISYEVFELPEEKLGALESARLLGVSPEKVFKTIVVNRIKPGKAILAVVPGNSEVDLKRLAKALGEKKLKLATQKEAEQMTGLETGGISPLALIKRGFQVVIDSSANDYDEIHISGGQRGLNIRLSSAALGKLVGARYAEIG
ncbi:MAG: aminoacyl-tRNA deacylase [Chloroflexota bacterium]